MTVPCLRLCSRPSSQCSSTVCALHPSCDLPGNRGRCSSRSLLPNTRARDQDNKPLVRRFAITLLVMQSLQARIDSFQKTKRVKRYPSRPSSSVASVRWPHPPSFKANADTLAEAGFFFSPSWDDRDSVACFLCGKELSDWDASDDPFEIHYTKCQSSCAWALVRCGLTEDLDNEGRYDKLKIYLPNTHSKLQFRIREQNASTLQQGNGEGAVENVWRGLVAS